MSGQTMVQKWPNDRSSHISSLRERDRQIVTLHDQQGLTMRQVAELMSVDESRISQLHAAALVRLKATVDSLLRPGQAETSEAGSLPRTAGSWGLTQVLHQYGPWVRMASMRRCRQMRSGVRDQKATSRLPSFFRRSTLVRIKSEPTGER